MLPPIDQINAYVNSNSVQLMMRSTSPMFSSPYSFGLALTTYELMMFSSE